MNKTELIDRIAELTDLEKNKVSKVVNAFLDVITECLCRHDSITLIGFGSFRVKRRQARQGVNPQTRKAMTIPAADVPVVSFGESLKEAVAKKKKTKNFLSSSNSNSNSKDNSKKKTTATSKKKKK